MSRGLSPTLTFLCFVSVALVTEIYGADKQYASKGRKEAPPFIDTQTNADHSPLLPPTTNRTPVPTQIDPGRPVADQAVTAPTDDQEERPFFFIFQIPDLVTGQQDPDYGWSPWGDWSPCSAECGVNSRHFRDRRCVLTPSEAGACRGDAIQWMPCDWIPCSGLRDQLPGGLDAYGIKETSAREIGDGKELERSKVNLVDKGMDQGKPTGKETQGNPEKEKDDLARLMEEERLEKEEEEEDDDSYGISLWRRCVAPCPFEIHIRQRRCYLGQFCIGARNEARVCSNRFGLLACGSVDFTGMESESGEGQSNDHSPGIPWSDHHIGWSAWTTWAVCSDNCCYHIQMLNFSRPCPGSGTGAADCEEDGPSDLRICRQRSGPDSAAATICGAVQPLSTWKLADESETKKKVLMTYNSRILHGVVILIIFAPIIVLFIYWVVTKSRRPRYEPLPSSMTTPASIQVNPQSTMATDASSAVGPNHLLAGENLESWKAI